jgi:acylpyruvate hydrolase
MASGTRAVRVEGDRAVALDFTDVGALLAHPSWRSEAAVPGMMQTLDLAELAPVIPHPGKIFCLGMNYRSHAAELGRELPDHPTLFAKFPSTLVGARDNIVLPAVSDEVDWEVELAFVIGARVKHASAADAASAIAGFTILNDISVRDYQHRTSQFLQGKVFEATAPVGPWLVTTEELGGAAPDLALMCEIDGEVMQQGRTSDLVWNPIDLVVYISQITTLEPGDLISTGTPAGVGYGREPRLFLRAGQRVRSSIEGIGELLNLAVKED